MDVDTAFISGNLVDKINYAGKGTFGAIRIEGKNNTPAFTEVSDNKIESIIVSNDYDSRFYGIELESAPARVYGNRIGSYSVPDDISIARKGASYGIYIYPLQANGTITVDRDTVVNISITQTDNTSSFIGINLDSQFSLRHIVTNNNVSNINSASTLEGYSTLFNTGTVINGIYLRSLRNSVPNDILSNNIVNNLHATRLQILF